MCMVARQQAPDHAATVVAGVPCRPRRRAEQPEVLPSPPRAARHGERRPARGGGHSREPAGMSVVRDHRGQRAEAHPPVVDAEPRVVGMVGAIRIADGQQHARPLRPGAVPHVGAISLGGFAGRDRVRPNQCPQRRACRGFDATSPLGAAASRRQRSRDSACGFPAVPQGARSWPPRNRRRANRRPHPRSRVPTRCRTSPRSSSCR